MIGHMSFGVADLERYARFYDAVLAPLGCVQVWRNDYGAGYGPPTGNDKLALFPQDEPSAARPGFHVAFVIDPDGYNIEAVSQ